MQLLGERGKRRIPNDRNRPPSCCFGLEAPSQNPPRILTCLAIFGGGLRCGVVRSQEEALGKTRSTEEQLVGIVRAADHSVEVKKRGISTQTIFRVAEALRHAGAGGLQAPAAA